MTTDADHPAPADSKTQINFDLADVLDPAELEKFRAAAAEAGAPSLTEHFLDLTLRRDHRAA